LLGSCLAFNYLYNNKACGNILDTKHEREQLGDQRNDGESKCNSGDGTGQMAQPWMFMMMMMMIRLTNK
jgi:hypothetical protein